MSYNVNNRLDYLGQRMDRINSETVTVTHDGTTDTITAVIGHTDLAEEFPGLAITQVRRQDFIVFGEEWLLKFGSYPTTQTTITRTNGYVYKCTPTGDDAPYNPTTPTDKRLRIHSNRIS